MAVKIGSLTLDIRANTTKLVQGMESGQKSVSRFAKSAKKLIGVIGVLAGGGALGLLIKRNIEVADSIGKVSDVVGLTTEAYQGYRHAAELAGVATSQFNSNMTAFIKRVGEARVGVGPLVSGLRNLDGVLLENLKNSRNQEDALNILADAMKGAKTVTDQAAIANAAFGRSGISMTLFLKDGSEGLAKVTKRAGELGIVMEDSLIRDAEIANDRLTELGSSISTIFTKAVIENAKAIEQFAALLISVIESSSKLIKQWGELQGAGSAVAALSFNRKLNSEITTQEQRVKNASQMVDNLNSKVGKFFTTERVRLNADLGLYEEEEILSKLIKKRKIILELQNSEKTNQTIINEVTKLPLGSAAPEAPFNNAPFLDLDDIRKKSESRIEVIRQSFLTENEIYSESLTERRNFVENALFLEVTDKQTANELLEQLTQESEDRKTKIVLDNEKTRNKAIAAGLGAASSIFSSLGAMMSKEGKKQTSTTRALARLSIVASTAQAVMNALAVPPYPLGVSLAVAAGLKGAQQLSKVGGSSGGSTSISQLTQTETAVDLGVPSGNSLTPNKTTQVIITGNVYSLDDFGESVVNVLQNATNDRDIVLFNRNSRQAQEIRDAS